MIEFCEDFSDFLNFSTSEYLFPSGVAGYVGGSEWASPSSFERSLMDAKIIREASGGNLASFLLDLFFILNSDIN